jgi:hypothetical protein
MRQFRLRWRWILVLAVVLFAAGGFLLRDLLTPDAQLAFDRVQSGMTIDKVNEVVTRYAPTDAEDYSRFFQPSRNTGYLVDVDYRFPDSTVSVNFFQGRLTEKRLYRSPKPTFWDALQAWLNRARVAVGV